MSGLDVVAPILMFVVFSAGALLGVLVIIALAYRREDQRGSLTERAPDALCQGTRRLTGVGTIGPAGWIPEQRTADDAAQRVEARR